MKRILAVALVLVMAMFLITACGGNDGSGAGLGNITAYGDNVESGDTVPSDSDSASGERASYIEAYLDILTENKAFLTTDEEWMFLADGKIAVTSVFRNEAPELLYIYVAEENAVNERLKIYTYSETEGAVAVFDAIIYAMAGGGGNYCVYLTRGGDLIVYYSVFGEFTYYGFWQIGPMSAQELAGFDDPYYVYFSYENRTDALLYLWTYPDEDNDYEMLMNYMQDGREISEDEFDRRADEMMGDIDRVLFQSTGLQEYGLYERDFLWMGMTPFKAESMTYAEAISWLES